MKFQALIEDTNWQKQRGCVRVSLGLNQGNGHLLPEWVRWCEDESWVRVHMTGDGKTIDFIAMAWRFKTDVDHGLKFQFDILKGEDVAEQLVFCRDTGIFFDVTVEEAEEAVYGEGSGRKMAARNKRKSFRQTTERTATYQCVD